jgi:ketopantoate hydroxymethyltransferase
MQHAFTEYINDVQSRSFPAVEHSVEMDDIEWRAFQENINKQ